MVGVGNIVSVGGAGGGGGGGAASGIQELNGQVGPTVTLVGTSGISIDVTSTNQISVGFTGDSSQSGVVGVNGIDVEQVDGNFVVDGASLSGLVNSCYTQSFTSQTSVTVNHNLNTSNVVVQVFDSNENYIIPDGISVTDIDNVAISFNRPQTGRAVILACGGSSSNSVSAALEEAKRYALLVS